MEVDYMDKKEQINIIDKLCFKALRELENYTKYCLRCLYRCGIFPQPTDFALLLLERNNGTIAEAVVYPSKSVKDGEVVDPMFFFGYKMDYDFRDLNNPIVVEYCDNIEDLIK